MYRTDQRAIDKAIDAAQAGGTENRRGERFDRDTARKAFARSFSESEYEPDEWAEIVAYFEAECERAEDV